MDNKQKNTTRKSVFDKISEKLFAFLKGGMFGYFFTSYDKANEKYQRRVKRKRRVHNNGPRRKISKAIEKSFFVNIIPKFIELIFRTSTRDFGITMLVMGAVTTVLYPLRAQILFINITEFTFLTGIIICLCSVPLLISSKTLATNLYTSKICNGFLFKFLGFDKERMRAMTEKDRHSSVNLAFLFGLLLGVLAYFIEPVKVVVIFFLLVLAYTTLRTPEIGTVAIVFALPFVSVNALCIACAYVFVCYVIKCIIGKRTFKFEYLDIFVVLAMAAIMLRGLVSKSLASTATEALICLCFALSYFLITNLIKSKEWFRRCAVALATSGTIVAIIAVLQVIIGRLSLSVPELERIFKHGQSVTSTLADASVLGNFMVALLPFALIRMISERRGSKKFVGFLFLALVLTVIGFTASLSAVIGAICAILLLLIIYHRNYTYLALVVIAACPILYISLPDDIMARIRDIRMLQGVTFTGFVEEFRHAFDLFMQNPFGIGMGQEVFANAYGENQQYVNSLPIQMLIEQGIINFAIIFTLLVMIARMTFSYCATAKNKYRRINCGAGFCSIFGIIMAGSVSYVFFDKKMYLLVCILTAVSFAYMKIDREDEGPKQVALDFTSATLDITLTGEHDHESVPKRKYVRMPRVKKSEEQSEAKEFDESEQEIVEVLVPGEELNQENEESENE